MNITRGPVKTAVKMLVYGPEGVGKTTFAAQVPGVVFIDTEGGTKHMDAARFDPPRETADVVQALTYVLHHPQEFGAVAIDTVDWLEKMIFDSVCAEKEIKNLEDIPYGKGYVFAKQKMQQLLDILQAIVDAGVHVVLVCHSTIRKFEMPDMMGSYDRYMLKLNEKNIAPIMKEWVDLMLFVNYRTDIVTDEKTKTRKGTGGQKRIMYANHSASWDAKNRFGLPDEMPFEFSRIAHLFERPEASAAAPEASPQTAPPPAKAEVTVTDRVPEAKPKKGVKKAPPDITRPESMKSEDPEKDMLLDQLWTKMLAFSVYDPLILQAVVAEKEYYGVTVPIRDYDKEFIEGCLLEAWDQVNSLCQTKIHDLPF